MATVPSPCKGVCQVDFENKYCEGCGRYLDEIAKWQKMSDKEKLDVLQLSMLRLNTSD